MDRPRVQLDRKDRQDKVHNKAGGMPDGPAKMLPEPEPPWKAAKKAAAAKKARDRQPVTKAEHDKHTGVLARLLRKTTYL